MMTFLFLEFLSSDVSGKRQKLSVLFAAFPLPAKRWLVAF